MSSKSPPPKDRDKVLAEARAKQMDPMAAIQPKRIALYVGGPIAIVWVTAFLFSGRLLI